MSSSREAAEQITAQLPDVTRGSIAVFGDIFGGRIDNIHTVISAEAADDPERLIVRFDQGETLEVWNPAGITVGSEVFRIGDATRVRWTWVLLRPPSDRIEPSVHRPHEEWFPRHSHAPHHPHSPKTSPRCGAPCG